MKYVFCKGTNGAGKIEYAGTIGDDDPTPAGCWAATEADLGGLMPIPWLEGKVWDNALGRPRAQTGAELFEDARAAKRIDLAGALDHDSREIEPSDRVFAFVWTELRNDPRTVANRALFQKYEGLKDRVDDLVYTDFATHEAAMSALDAIRW